MSAALGGVIERARAKGHRIVLAGGPDDDLTRTAERIGKAGLGAVTTVGGDGLDPAADSRLGAVAERLRQAWPERVRDGIHGLDLAVEPILFAAGLVLLGEAQALIAATGVPIDVVEDAFRWLLGPDRDRRGRGSMAYALTASDRLLATATPDTAGPLDPFGAAGLALAAATHRRLAVGDQPRVGFLVAPPSQDASHADAELALREFKAIAPGIQASVEWSWAAGRPDPGRRFPPGPNVLIFPDPVSGHLTHEMLRDVAAGPVIGPLFPGSEWAVVRLNAGLKDEDIVAVAGVAAAGLRGA